jgi:hypothetical protein
MDGPRLLGARTLAFPEWTVLPSVLVPLRENPQDSERIANETRFGSLLSIEEHGDSTRSVRRGSWTNGASGNACSWRVKSSRLAERAAEGEQFAELSGFSQQYLSGLERGRRNPTVVTVY